MKKHLIFLLININYFACGQVQKSTTKLDVIGNNLLLTPISGNSIQIPATLKHIKEFNTYTQSAAIFDGSVWKRVSGTTSTTASLGYGAMQTESVGGFYYKRLVEGAVNVTWFGAQNDIAIPKNVYPLPANVQAAVRANTAAIQKALDYVASAINGAELTSPLSKGIPNSLYFPSGTFFVSSILKVKGPMRIFGDGGTAFGGTKIQQTTPNTDLFWLTGEMQKGNLAVQIEDLKVNCANSSTEASTFYVGTTGSIHSIYFYRVWFQGTDKYFLKILKGDDLKVVDCTFDGSEWYGFYLGDPTNVANVVSNAAITGCTFYALQKGLGFLNNIDGFLFANNRVYGANEKAVVPLGIDAVSHCVSAKRIQIVNNTFYRINNTFTTGAGNFIFSNNTVSGVTGSVLNLGANGNYTVSNSIITNNVISGIWRAMTSLNGTPPIPNAPIYAHGNGTSGTRLVNNIIRDNSIIDSSNTSLQAVYAPDSRNVGNTVENTVHGFRSSSQIGGPVNQIIDRTTIILSFTTTRWSTNSYTQVVAPNTLADATIYLVKAVYNRPGQDRAVQSWVVPISATNSGSVGTAVDLIGNYAIYGLGTNRYIKLRLKQGSSTFGLEAALSTADMANSLATVNITITPLL